MMELFLIVLVLLCAVLTIADRKVMKQQMNDIDLLRHMEHELTETSQQEQFMPIIRKISELIYLAECVAVATDLDLIRLRGEAKKILEVDK